jgi:hypothetical protein
LEFGPNRSQVRLLRNLGIGLCFAAAVSLVVPFNMATPLVSLEALFCAFGLFAGVTGVRSWVSGSRGARLRAVLTPDALRIVAHAGRHPWYYQPLAEASIPWTEIQGVMERRVSNLPGPGGIQTTYILYSKRGDFTLRDIQWVNLEIMIREITARSGRVLGEIAPERSAVLTEVNSKERRAATRQRVFGWFLLIVCVPWAVVVVITGLSQGFSSGLIRAAAYLFVGLAAGISMVRFSRR